jgi:class 3 adenylate cyclase/tetratricopeptide (TPR) repeat protein
LAVPRIASDDDEQSNSGAAALQAGADGKVAPDAHPVEPFEGLICPNCDTPALPMASFCSHCGTRLRSPSQPLDVPNHFAERRQVTIVFCDLVGSAALTAKHEVEDVADVLHRYYATVGTVIASFGGYIARLIGDGGLFYFGYPTASEDDSKRAVDAALAIVAAIAHLPPQLGSRLQVRIGISSGIVVVGDLLGATETRGNDIVGDAANLAARLQQLAVPGQILVSEGVHELTRTLFHYEEIGRVSLRGWPEPVPVWRPDRAVAYVDRFTVRLVSGVAPLVGRTAERAVLHAAWEQARSGAGRVILLVGEPGIGKSRLAHELMGALVPQGTAQRRYFCASMQQNVALHPFIDQLTHSGGLTAADSPAERLAKLSALLEGAEAADVALLADLVVPGTGSERPGGGEASPTRRERILEALLGSVLRQAANGPLVVLIEDAHWIDPTSRDLLARLVSSAPGRALLLLVTARPQFRPDWVTSPDVLRLELDPLRSQESAILVRSTSGAIQLADDVVRDIVARADGVPLYLEEVTRSILEPGGGEVRVPASLHASLLSRIDRLGPARTLAETAAAIGRAFDLALLAAVCGTTEAVLLPRLERLVTSGLLQRSGAADRATYTFRHALICDATYGTIVRARRHAIHARIAETIEQHFPADATAQPQVLALHYTAAALDQKAATWWLRAGLQSLRLSAMTEALTQLRRALALLETLPDDTDRQQLELDVLVVYGKALLATEGHAADITGEVFARARALCHRLGDPPQLLTVLFVQWGRAFFRVQLDDAEARAADLLRGASQREDEMWLVMGYYTLGFVRFLRGGNDEAIGLLRQGIAHYDPARRHLYAGPTIGDPRVVMRTYLSWSLRLKGAFAECEREAFGAVEEARELSQQWLLGLALTQLAYGLLQLRGPDASEPYLQELEDIAAGADWHTAIALVLRGWHLAARGDPAAGLLVAREGRGRIMAVGAGLHVPHCLRAEAGMLLQLGRAAEALESVEAGHKIQQRTCQYWDASELHRRRGEVLLALGQVAAAEAEMFAALRISRERDEHMFGLRAAISLTRLHAARDDPAASLAILREERALVDDDPAILDVAAADDLLARLGTAP